jgi:hypothetical protein
MMQQEPVIHSHITDVLPDNHLQAFQNVCCGNCGVLVHAFNNECMQTWVETGRGAFCLRCFAMTNSYGVLDDGLAL